jgi:hypothetical protein
MLSASIPSTFETLLDALTTSHEFDDDDRRHLGRWRRVHSPGKLWQAIRPQFNVGEAEEFIRLNLELRRAAEKADKFNDDRPALEREIRRLAPQARRRVLKRLAESAITPHQHAAISRRIGKATERSRFYDPLLSKRSDKRGSRARTIFCRVMSETLHNASGRCFDRQVAELCQFAFGGEVTIDMVRSARRESTPNRTKRK